MRIIWATVLFAASSVFGQPAFDLCFPCQDHLHNWNVLANGQLFQSRRGTGAWSVNGLQPAITGMGVRAGVLDFDLENFHPDLVNQFAVFLDAGLDDGVGNDHGTAIAGLLAAELNGTGVQGVAWGAKLVYGATTTIGGMTQAESIADRMIRADQLHDVGMISNSWFFSSVDQIGFDLVDSTMIELERAGILNPPAGDLPSGRDGRGLPFVFAAGNDSIPAARSPTQLAASQAVIAVADVNSGGLRHFTSNFGLWITVGAPGQNVFTSLAVEGGDNCPLCCTDNCPETAGCPSACSDPNNLSLGFFGGTSSAAPIVSGAIALMLQANPNLEAPQIKRILAHTARPVNFTGDAFGGSMSEGVLQYSPLRRFSDSMGYGLVDAQAAVDEALNSANAALPGQPPLTWPAEPHSLTATDMSDHVHLEWTNPSAPSGVFALGEFDQVMIVRYVGNVFDQGAFPRSAPTPEVGLETLEQSLWLPIDGKQPTTQDQTPPTGIAILASGAFSSFDDMISSEQDSYSYAIFVVNERLRYSKPAVILKPATLLSVIAPSDVSLSPGALEVGAGTQSPIHELPIAMSTSITANQDFLALTLTADANGDGRFYSLYGGLTSQPLVSQGVTTETLTMDFDLTDAVDAKLRFKEIVEVFGFSGGWWQRCELTICELDRGLCIGTPDVRLKDHVFFTFDHHLGERGEYDWRQQEIDLSSHVGSHIRVTWSITLEEVVSASPVIDIRPTEMVGWLIDEVVMSAEPACSAADFDNNGSVDGGDLAFLLVNWGNCPTPPTPCQADLNGDSVVDAQDEAILLALWGPCSGNAAIAGPPEESSLTEMDPLDGGMGPGSQATASDAPWIIQHFGFDTVSAYIEWISMLTEDQLLDHIVEVLHLLLGED